MAITPFFWLEQGREEYLMSSFNGKNLYATIISKGVSINIYLNKLPKIKGFLLKTCKRLQFVLTYEKSSVT